MPLPTPRLLAVAALALLAAGCTLKDPKLSAGTLPDPAAAGALLTIDEAGERSQLGALPPLCGNPQFGRVPPSRASGAVRIPCWDGTGGL